MMINHALWNLAARTVDADQVLMHDWWFALIAAACGKIGFVPHATIQYRQHGDNSVGAKNSRSIRFVMSQIRKGNGNRKAMEDTMKQADTLQKNFTKEMRPDDQKIVAQYASLQSKGKWKRVFVVIRYRIWKTGLKRKLAEIFYL